MEVIARSPSEAKRRAPEACAHGRRAAGGQGSVPTRQRPGLGGLTEAPTGGAAAE